MDRITHFCRVTFPTITAKFINVKNISSLSNVKLAIPTIASPDIYVGHLDGAFIQRCGVCEDIAFLKFHSQVIFM